jgi:putative acetyltransferase
MHPLDANSSPTALAAAKELLREYGRFVAAQPAIATFCARSLEQEAEGLPDSFIRLGGGSIVASCNSAWSGFVAWRALNQFGLAAPSLAWELKRLWIRPNARGLGLGRTLVNAVIDRARQAGKSQLLLDTAPQSMPAAYRLYLEMGFSECPPYNNGPFDGIVYMCKQL